MPRKKKSDSAQDAAAQGSDMSVFDAINKKYGAGTVLDSSNAIVPVDVIPTGSINLDRALGVGGWPRGRISEVSGKPSGGKTTLCLHAIVEAQKLGLKTAFIDAEHALDLSYAASVGVDVPKLAVSQPDYGEQALEIACMMVESGQLGLVVVDSVAALTPKAELEGEVGDAHVGLQARMMSQSLRKMTAAAHKGNTCLLFVNQERAKIGGFGFGPKTTTAGGNALPYYSSVRVSVTRVGSVVQGDLTSGNRVEAKVNKNKLAPPFHVAEFQIAFGRGIDQEGEVLELAVDAGVVECRGAHVYFGETKLGASRAKAKDFLRSNSDVLAVLREAVMKGFAA